VYARPLSLLLAVKRRARTAPELWIVPKPLTDTSIERSAGRKFSCFGYQFAAPWTDVKQEKNSKSLDIIRFASDTVVIFFDDYTFELPLWMWGFVPFSVLVLSTLAAITCWIVLLFKWRAKVRKAAAQLDSGTVTCELPAVFTP
jgi:hypothetical protein